MIHPKNILFVSPFFYPEPISTGKFNTEIVIELAKKGHKVTVLCFHPLYPNWKIEKSNAVLENIKIIRGGRYLVFSNNSYLRRLILEISFALFIIRNLFKFQKEYNLLIAVFPPSFYLFTVFKILKKNTRIIGMVHDLQQIYSSEKKGFFNKLITTVISKIEKGTLQNCDKLIFLSEEMKCEAEKMYNLNSINCSVQYPFHSLDITISCDLDQILRNDVKNIVYSGALGEKQNPYELYEFFDFVAKKSENIEFHIFSKGFIFNDLRLKNRSNKIKFHDLVKSDNLTELYIRSDIQIIPQKPNTSKGSFPSKLPNLLVSGTNLLVITDKNSELESFFNKYNLTQTVNSWNFDNLLEVVNNILLKPKINNHHIKIAKELFTIDEMITKILT